MPAKSAKTSKAKKKAEPKKAEKPVRMKVEEVPETKPADSPIASFSQLDTPATPAKDETETNKEKEETVVSGPLVKKEIESPPKEESGQPVSESADEPSTTQVGTEEDTERTSSTEVKEWLSQVKPDTTKEIEKKDKKLSVKTVVLISLVLALLGALVGGVYYYKKNIDKSSDQTQQQAVPTAQPTTKPTQAPTPEPIDLSDYSIQVLNGSGVAGEAGKAADLLEEAGFTEPDTANASSYDFTTTIISLKKDTPDQVYEKIKESLASSYIVEKSDDILDEDSSYDATVTVGSKKASQ
jgi:hypothetical protein